LRLNYEMIETHGDWKLGLQLSPRRLEIAATQTMSASADGRNEIQPAQAGFVCVDAVSTAGFFQPAKAGFVCVYPVSTAVSTAGYLNHL
jgi:hypothetical protein